MAPLSERPAARGYIPAVDGLRAIAALAVVAFHTGLLPVGWAGVWLFYVISGFVITRGMVMRDWRLSGPAYLRFFIARVRRIWPLYFLFIVIAGLASAALAGHPPGLWTGLLPIGEVLTLSTFTQNFYQMLGYAIVDMPTSRGFDHLWTISVEQQFYLFFPFAFAFARRIGPVKALWPVVAGAIMLRILFAWVLLRDGVEAETTSSMLYFFSPGHFDAFAAGMLLAFYVARLGERRVRRIIYAAAVLAVLAFLGNAGLDPAVQEALARHALPAAADALRPYFGSHPTEPVAMVSVYAVVVLIASALMASVISAGSVLNIALRWRPLVWIGQISYGVYIWHRVPVNIAEAIIGPPSAHPPLLLRLTALVLVTAVSIGLAYLSYHFYERRFHKRIGT